MTFKSRLRKIIFEADTPAGKAFDIILLLAIILSIVVVMLETVKPIDAKYHQFFFYTEWILTILFTIEYVLRLYLVQKPTGYALSFFGIIDLLAILPSYISVFIPGSQLLLVTRSLRLLRVFRVLKLTRYIRESQSLIQALVASRRKITVFLFAVLMLTVILGTLMYIIEGGQNGFTSIPRSIYWAIVTLTTVGYGDISPVTVMGQFVASFIMILGYGIIAIPTGLISVELSREAEKQSHVSCPNCSAEGHRADADFCYNCGHELIHN